MNDVNTYLSKIKNTLFIILIIFVCLYVAASLINEFYTLEFMQLPEVIKEFSDEQDDKTPLKYFAFALIIYMLAYVLLYKEKLSGLYLLFFGELYLTAFSIAVEFVEINTPSGDEFGTVLNFLTGGIATVVAIKLLLNHNFDMSTVRRKIGSSGLIKEDVYKLAKQGNAEAQINLGSLYFKGIGVPQDFPQAHMWYNLASATGNILAAKNRDLVAKKMTTQQVADAQELAKEFLAKQVQE